MDGVRPAPAFAATLTLSLTRDSPPPTLQPALNLKIPTPRSLRAIASTWFAEPLPLRSPS